MGVSRAADRACQARRPSACNRCSRSSERDLLCALDRVSVEGVAQGPAAEEHGARLLHAVGLGRHTGAHPPRVVCPDSRARGTRCQPECGHHRQPERQSRPKGGKSLDPQGFDAGKKVTGRKRHILVDTLGLLLNVVVHSADIQDRDGAALVLDKRTRRQFPFIERIYADGGYQGPRVRAAAARTGTWKIEIIKRSDIARGFVVLPKRWVVERTLAWISRNRRLARDFERYARTVAAFVRLAMIRIMLRRLTRPCPSN
jgi:transposase